MRLPERPHQTRSSTLRACANDLDRRPPTSLLRPLADAVDKARAHVQMRVIDSASGASARDAEQVAEQTGLATDREGAAPNDLHPGVLLRVV